MANPLADRGLIVRSCILFAGLGTGLVFLFTGEAAAAGAQSVSEHADVVFVAQIVVLLTCGRLLGEAMQRLGQPAIMGQLLAGVMLGPSLLGAVWPSAEQWLFPAAKEQKAMLDAVAHLGILLLLLLTGMEMDLKLVRKVGRSSFFIALTGLTVPFLCGFALGWMLPAGLLPRPELRLAASLFLGTALSISSVKIVAVIIREMDFMRRDIGQIIVAAAIIEDTIGWIIIALIFGIAANGKLDAAAFSWSVLGTIVFLGASLTLGRRLVALLIRWANDSFVSEFPVITTILILMGLMALATDAIGVHTVLGAFVAGMIVGQSPILTGHIDDQLRGLITALFMPVFFAVAGLGADLTVLADPKLLALTVGLVAIASVGKFAGAFAGGRWGGLTVAQSFAVGSAMNARGSTEVIVASIGLSMGVLSQDLYTMIVAMAVITTLAMPPMLRWALLRLPLEPKEKERLEREAREAKGFVAQLERILLTVDNGPNAKLAAHIAGLIAGSREILTTVLQLDTKPANATVESVGEASPEAVVKSSAQSARGVEPPQERSQPGVDVTTRSPEKAQTTTHTVEREARKGYDLMMLGVSPVSDAEGTICGKVSEAASAFDGPIAIVAARGSHCDQPTPPRFNILLPIRATHYSHRAAELAIALAHASNSPIEAVFVSEHPLSDQQTGAAALGLEEDSALRDVIALAKAQDVFMRILLERDELPATAIVRTAERARSDLIVLGVSRRPGKNIYFGKVAAEILQTAPCTLLLVSS